jgi:hypothetical protein
MSKRGQRPLVTTRRVFVAVWLLLVFAMAGTIVVEGPWIESTTTPSVTRASATPSPSLPSGYRWYWFRSQWQQPEQPEP